MRAYRWNQHYRAFKRLAGKAVSDDPDLLLAAFLDHRLKSLKSQAYYSGPDGSAQSKRAYRELRSIFLKRRFANSGRKRRILQKPAALLFQVKPHLLRDTLCPKFTEKYVPMRRRLKQRTCKEVQWSGLSFARDPEHTLSLLSELSSLCATRADLRLNFADTVCDDVTPYVVLARLRSALPPVISGGAITREVRDVVTAVGLREDLKMGSIKALNGREDDYDVSPFKMTSRAPPGTFGDKDHQLRPQVKEIVADRFVNTLNSWIGAHDLELVPAAEGNLVSAIGEALDNAERHGDAIGHQAEGDWSIAAFSRLMFDDSGAPLLRCSIGIVSIGATISESLTSAAEPVRRHIDQYVGLHSSMFSSAAKEDALRTVMALQDGITRDSKASTDRRGGVGFMELMDVIAELGENGRPELPSVFTIVSGQTCIRITGKYRQGTQRTGILRELWFNEHNDPGIPPSKEHVMTLNHNFPGVILSACFTIDPEHLRKKLDDDDTDNG